MTLEERCLSGILSRLPGMVSNPEKLPPSENVEAALYEQMDEDIKCGDLDPTVPVPSAYLDRTAMVLLYRMGITPEIPIEV